MGEDVIRVVRCVMFVDVVVVVGVLWVMVLWVFGELLNVSIMMC